MSQTDSPDDLLEGYVTLAEASAQPRMPSLRTLQRMAAERRLDGLVYFGRTPFLHLQTFRASLAARALQAVPSPRKSRRR